MPRPSAKVERLDVEVVTIPTDGPEADGTLAWRETTVVLVTVVAGGKTGLGYSYTGRAAAGIIGDVLKGVVVGRDVFGVAGANLAMQQAVRNLGRAGVCATAISAVDTALWDCKAKLLDLPLVKLLGQARDAIPLYGSGGFTNYDAGRLERQMQGWAAEGFRYVKLKVGRDAAADVTRVAAVRKAVGDEVEIFVDANGAYTRKVALAQAERFAPFGVTWFEEPVSSDDLEGLRLLRDRGPGAMAIAAGEYGYDAHYFRRMLAAGAVDVLQADATRCLGVTGYLQAAALCAAYNVPLSSHCAPALHVHLDCAAQPAVHLEYFHDHVRIEEMLFAGAPRPQNGKLQPDVSRPGLGLEVKHATARKFAA